MARNGKIRVKINKQQLRAILREDTQKALREDCEKIAETARKLDPQGNYQVEIHTGINRAYAYVTADNMWREANKHYLSIAHKAVTT